VRTEIADEPEVEARSGSRLVPGTAFPDYELTGHDRKRYRLSDVQGSDPMIVVLSRGHYCPKDFQQHKLLVDFYPQIAVAYAQIVTISTDSIYEANEMRDSLGAQWLFLTDPGRKVQKDLGIKEYTDPTHDPMIPHTLVLEPGLKIYSVYNGYWFWGRPSPGELWQDLREVSRRLRPDWDLADPRVRASWDGDRRKHFPYTGR
jgi:peroxiredoxin